LETPKGEMSYTELLEATVAEQVQDWAKEWEQELTLPSPQDIVAQLFDSPALVWYRLTESQDVTMRLLAERVVAISHESPVCIPSAPSSSKQSVAQRRQSKAAQRQSIEGIASQLRESLSTDSRPSNEDSIQSRTQKSMGPTKAYTQTAYLDGEIVQRLRQTPVSLPPLRKDCTFHLYCSPNCPDGVAEQLAIELRTRYLPMLTFTLDPKQLEVCEHMLIVLTDQTWDSHAFAREVCEAMRHGVHRLLVHELPGARLGDNEARHACSFEQIIASTPKHIRVARLYDEIAQNVGGGEWRSAGIAKMAVALAQGSGSRHQWRQPVEDRRLFKNKTFVLRGIRQLRKRASAAPLSGERRLPRPRALLRKLSQKKMLPKLSQHKTFILRGIQNLRIKTRPRPRMDAVRLPGGIAKESSIVNERSLFQRGAGMLGIGQKITQEASFGEKSLELLRNWNPFRGHRASKEPVSGAAVPDSSESDVAVSPRQTMQTTLFAEPGPSDNDAAVSLPFSAPVRQKSVAPWKRTVVV